MFERRITKSIVGAVSMCAGLNVFVCCICFDLGSMVIFLCDLRFGCISFPQDRFSTSFRVLPIRMLVGLPARLLVGLSVCALRDCPCARWEIVRAHVWEIVRVHVGRLSVVVVLANFMFH